MKLFFFTNSYPYGLPDNWKTIEIEEFSKHYEQIVIFPFNDAGVPGIKVELPPNSQVLSPLLQSGRLAQALVIAIKTMVSFLPWYFFKELLRARPYRKWHWLKRWIRNSYYTAAIYFDPRLQQLIRETDADATWYFYWGNHMALVIPLIRGKVKHIACRVHNSDLYSATEGGYLPYQQQILENADIILPCSEDGRRYLISNLNIDGSKISVARLGVLQQTQYVSITDSSPFRIVSCSFLYPAKRVRMIADALRLLPFAIHWTHIGPGEELSMLQSYCREFRNDNMHVQFTGYMKHEDIIPFYLANNFQLFINVSLFEGIPVSIMEAMSVGIPVMATDVGGTRELVSSSVGVLLPAVITPEELASELVSFRNQSLITRQGFSENSVRTIKETYNGRSNAAALFRIFMTRFNYGQSV